MCVQGPRGRMGSSTILWRGRRAVGSNPPRCWPGFPILGARLKYWRQLPQKAGPNSPRPLKHPSTASVLVRSGKEGLKRRVAGMSSILTQASGGGEVRARKAKALSQQLVVERTATRRVRIKHQPHVEIAICRSHFTRHASGNTAT